LHEGKVRAPRGNDATPTATGNRRLGRWCGVVGGSYPGAAPIPYSRILLASAPRHARRRIRTAIGMVL